MNVPSPSKIAAAVAGCVMIMAALLVPAAGATAAETSERPDTPVNLRITDVSPDGFTLRWDPVDGDVFYLVERVFIRPNGSRVAFPPVRVMDGHERSFSTKWGDTYELSVRARTKVSPVLLSEWSDPVTVTTPLPEGYEPPSAPTGLRVAERNADGEVILLRWDPPVQRTEPLTYIVHLDHPVLGAFSDFSVEPSLDTRRLPLNVGYVDEPGLTVTLRVSATDRARNTSPRSEPLQLVCCPF